MFDFWSLQQVRPGLVALSQQILGPNTLIQGALPEILAKTPPSFFENSMKVIQVSVQILLKLINNSSS